MRQLTTRPAALAAALLLFPLPGVALAQRAGVQTIELSRPDAEWDEPFTSVGGVRELRDGRIVVTDRTEKSIQLLDLAANSAMRLGKEGTGPNEYATPNYVFALPGDSTLVHDAGQNRYLLLAPDGAVVRTISLIDSNQPDMRLLMPRASDGFGNLYFADRGVRLGGPGAPGRFERPDSGAVIRYDLRTKQISEVGTVALPKMNVSASGGAQQQRFTIQMSNPYAPQDDWTVGLDGRLAVVRHDPYRVEWVSPSGQRVVGPDVAYEPVRVTEKDKENYRSARANVMSVGTRVTIGGGPGGGSAPPPSSMANIRPPEPANWPEFKPAFASNTSVVAPDGRLWVRRQRPAEQPAHAYDVFDSFGKRVAQVVLPENTRLVGFGARHAYLVRTDADDLQWLERYRLF